MPQLLRPLASAVVLFMLMGSLTACSKSSEAGSSATEDLPAVTVYKSPTCGCCTEWVEHMEANGFEVEVEDMANVAPVKERLGVPQQLQSCHTAHVDGYAIEGHVPADVVKTFLEEAPDVTGLAVPGMPIGSPGMEIEGRAPQPYEVLAFGEQGASVYARR